MSATANLTNLTTALVGEVEEHVASEFYALYLGLLVISMIASYVLESRQCCPYLSEAGVTLLIGVVAGGVVLFISEEEALRSRVNIAQEALRSKLNTFGSDILLNLLLPPIVFESGYHLRGPFFWANIDKIMCLAFVGTLASTLAIGGMIHAMSGLFFRETFNLVESMTFGALISATDPVTTLAIFEQVGVDPHLFNVIFGESVLNDAVGIVLFNTFAGLIESEFGFATLIWHAIFKALSMFALSALLGFAAGCIVAAGFKLVNAHVDMKLELGIYVLTSYLPYLISECVGLSGIVAVLFAGLSMKRYTIKNLSDEAASHAEAVQSMLAHIADMVIFLDLGTSAWTTWNASASLIICGLIACLVARALHVYPIGILLRLLPVKYPRRKFEWPEIHMVWFAGLRGAIAYGLSTQFPDNNGNRHKIMSLTMAIVLISVWVMGGATTSVLNFLNIRRVGEQETKQLELTLQPSVKRNIFFMFDRAYLSPWLTAKPLSSNNIAVPHKQRRSLFETAPVATQADESAGLVSSEPNSSAREVHLEMARSAPREAAGAGVDTDGVTGSPGSA